MSIVTLGHADVEVQTTADTILAVDMDMLDVNFVLDIYKTETHVILSIIVSADVVYVVLVTRRL